MERLNDHKTRSQRAWLCIVHVFDFCHDWTKYLQRWRQRRAFASVRRSLNLEPLSGNKSLAFINAECTVATLTVALTGAADMFVNWRA